MRTSTVESDGWYVVAWTICLLLPLCLLLLSRTIFGFGAITLVCTLNASIIRSKFFLCHLASLEPLDQTPIFSMSSDFKLQFVKVMRVDVATAGVGRDPEEVL